jgi:hypothetical protein
MLEQLRGVKGGEANLSLLQRALPKVGKIHEHSYLH